MPAMVSWPSPVKPCGMSDDEYDLAEKLERAADHDDRAEGLRLEALQEAARALEDAVDGTISTDLQTDGEGNITGEIQLTFLQDQFQNAFDDATVFLYPARIKIGESAINDHDRITNMKGLIERLEENFDEGAPIEVIKDEATEAGFNRTEVERELDKLRDKGEVYEPTDGYLRTV